VSIAAVGVDVMRRPLHTAVVAAVVAIVALGGGAVRAQDQDRDDTSPRSAAAAASDAPAEDDVEGDVAGDDDGTAPKRAITILPLRPGRTITSKQAAGITARLRVAADALDKEGAITLLPTTKDDDKAVRRCGDKADCYNDVAAARGADIVVYGLIDVGDGGLLMKPAVAGSAAPTTTYLGDGVLLTGDDDRNGLALDRLARELCAPQSLRGTLMLSGQPGDSVFIDGRRRGSVDADGAFVAERLREGTHQVRVERPAGKNGAFYAPFERAVPITHRDEVKIKITLLPKDGSAAMADGQETPGGPPGLAIAGVAVGGVAVAAGAVVGVFSLLDSFAVEERAEAQQLVFPRDTELVTRGQTLALVANILYGVGAVAGGAGALWWALGSAEGTAEGTTEDGAP